jgi:hypothetical protein
MGRESSIAVTHCAHSSPYHLPQDRFVLALKSLQAKHLAATLTYLNPANALPLWAAKVQVRRTACNDRRPCLYCLCEHGSHWHGGPTPRSSQTI